MENLNVSTIGIIAAMDEEIKTIKNLMENIKEQLIFELKFYCGKINNTNVVLVKCGIGKVNAARVTQILIDNFKLNYIINVGTAGSINDNLEIGDIVVASKLIQYDFDISAFGHKVGYIPNIGEEIGCDLIDLVNEKLLKIKEDLNINIGKIATGDKFVQSIDIKEKIKKQFSADCVEMEGAAIAQICKLNGIPFLIIRAISDKPNGNNSIDFNKFIEYACIKYAKFIKYFID